jgi:hypothetical protein
LALDHPNISDYSPRSRNIVIALSFFLGILGAHRFYLGKFVTGVIWLLTMGLLGFGAIYDFFNSIFGTYRDSRERLVNPEYNKVLAWVLIGLFALNIIVKIARRI